MIYFKWKKHDMWHWAILLIADSPTNPCHDSRKHIVLHVDLKIKCYLFWNLC